MSLQPIIANFAFLDFFIVNANIRKISYQNNKLKEISWYQ